MPRMPARRKHVEWGDYQTPPGLAGDVVRCLARTSAAPASVVEPTCGRGELLIAALGAWPGLRVARGVEIAREHAHEARTRVGALGRARDVQVIEADAFATDWRALLERLPAPVLCLGNPPWVTNAAIGRARGSNLPRKHNADRVAGIAARTGTANFDLSEALLRAWIDAARGLEVEFAFLVKSSVARKVLAYAWRTEAPVADAVVHAIDARAAFGVAVDACLLRFRLHPAAIATRTCRRASSLDVDDGPSFGWLDGRLVADAELYDRWRGLDGANRVAWRSGVKHDVADVLEFVVRDGELVNGLGERVELEDEHVFPLRKAADLAAPPGRAPERRILLPQRATGDATDERLRDAPLAAAYLASHAERFDRRKSSIYAGRARHALFGVGPYTFAPWKVAVSGLAKRITFAPVGPVDGRPCVLDDTSYFLPCADEEVARRALVLLESEAAREFLAAHVFVDAKRPVTAALLNRLDLAAVARVLGRPSPWEDARPAVEGAAR